MTIKELRTRTGMSQSQFAKYFNIPPSTLKKWEQGQRLCPSYLLDLIEYKLRKENKLKTDELFPKFTRMFIDALAEFEESQRNE